MDVSVIIPMYNQKPEYFKECLESAISQTYPKDKYEIIVVNDGSTKEDTLKELQKWKDKNISNMKFIDKENGRTASALNAGIKEMTGEWFMWLSSDDVWFPDKIEKQISLMKNNFSDGKVFYSDWIRIDAKGNIIRREKEPEFKHIEDLQFHLCFRFFGCGSTIMIHKSCFDQIGLFNEEILMCEDYEMWGRLAKIYMFYKIPHELMKYRTHSEMLTNDPESYNTYLLIVDKIRELMDYKDVVSVIVTAYNEEKTIKECINSIMQDVPFVDEIIVVDDCSTDKTSEIIRSFKTAPCEITLYTLDKNRGRGYAKMFGVSKARNKLVCTVDGDIILIKGWLEFLLQNMVKFGGVGAVAGSVRWVNDVKFPWCDEINLIMTHIGQTAIGTAVTLFHKKVLEDYPIDVNLKDGEDSDLFLRLQRDNIPFYKCKAIIGKHVDNMNLLKFLERNYQYGYNRAMLFDRHRDQMRTPHPKEISDDTDVVTEILNKLRVGCSLLGFKEQMRKLEQKVQFPKWGERK